MAKSPIESRLLGQFVSLTRIDPEFDVDALFRISHADAKSRELFRYLQRGPYETVDEMRSFFVSWAAKSGTVCYIVRCIDNGEVVGTLSLMNTREEHGVIEIGNVWYAPSSQRTKTNTESVYLLLQYCFEFLGYRRVEWKCDVRNIPSGKAALRLGFTFEGIFRKHMLIRNLNRDTAWFAMIDDEWPARKLALSRWLYTDDTKPLSEIHSSELQYRP